MNLQAMTLSRNLLAFAILVTLYSWNASSLPLQAEPPASVEIQEGFQQGKDLFADTWVATDALGRNLPGVEVCGPPKKEKWVGIFYWTWHTGTTGIGRGTLQEPSDNSKILATAKQGRIDWANNPRAHYWGEPELGYYRMTDPFVIRKHASMLADAGIDVVIFDTTNPPFTFKEEYEALCREYTAMRAEGAKTPAIAFITPFGDPRPVVHRLWRDLYSAGRWSDLWFQWENKPLLLADKKYIEDEQIKKFFTFRRPMPDYWIGPNGPDQWSWLEVYPQHIFKNSQGEAEQMSVGVAQNAIPNTPGPAPMSHKVGAMGRSWFQGKKDPRSEAVYLGLNFQQQWQRAIDVDPKFVFVTGWNEWIAGRYDKWSKYTDEDCYYPGGLFVDQYDHEYSRDCEPMRGGHGDSYYYQLASWVRRFKGVRELPLAEGPSKIVVDGNFDDWSSVKPDFRDTVGDTTHRDHPGYGSLVYRNSSGRNDIVNAKVAYDSTSVSFYVQTKEKMSPSTDKHWMLLLIDSDQSAQTGWLGYDLLVNGRVSSPTQTIVQSWQGDRWQELGHAAYRVAGDRLELQLPREWIGQPKETPSFDFHWADNLQSFDDASGLGLDGDSAPNRRANYRFQVKSIKSK